MLRKIFLWDHEFGPRYLLFIITNILGSVELNQWGLIVFIDVAFLGLIFLNIPNPHWKILPRFHENFSDLIGISRVFTECFHVVEILTTDKMLFVDAIDTDLRHGFRRVGNFKCQMGYYLADW